MPTTTALDLGFDSMDDDLAMLLIHDMENM